MFITIVSTLYKQYKRVVTDVLRYVLINILTYKISTKVIRIFDNFIYSVWPGVFSTLVDSR